MKPEEAQKKYFNYINIGSNTFAEIFKCGIKEGKRREKARIKKEKKKPIPESS